MEGNKQCIERRVIKRRYEIGADVEATRGI
jgi:hypothetical protein